MSALLQDRNLGGLRAVLCADVTMVTDDPVDICSAGSNVLQPPARGGYFPFHLNNLKNKHNLHYKLQIMKI